MLTLTSTIYIKGLAFFKLHELVADILIYEQDFCAMRMSEEKKTCEQHKN